MEDSKSLFADTYRLCLNLFRFNYERDCIINIALLLKHLRAFDAFFFAEPNRGILSRDSRRENLEDKGTLTRHMEKKQEGNAVFLFLGGSFTMLPFAHFFPAVRRRRRTRGGNGAKKVKLKGTLRGAVEVGCQAV